MINKFKVIDCKLLFCQIENLKRQKMMAKVKEDNYIFLQRSNNIN